MCVEPNPKDKSLLAGARLGQAFLGLLEFNDRTELTDSAIDGQTLRDGHVVYSIPRHSVYPWIFLLRPEDIILSLRTTSSVEYLCNKTR
jgi:hypothetical protein